MKKEEIKEILKQDQEEGLGELLEEKDGLIQYFNYETDMDDDCMTFRHEEVCTKENLTKIIWVSERAAINGITPEIVADILSDAYGEMLPDAMMVLTGVAVIHDESDMKNAVEKFCFSDSDEILNDELDDFFEDNFVGKTWFRRQLAFINEGLILKTAKEIAKERGDDITSPSVEYTDGIGETVIHEVRHIMLDCNFILPEDKYPISLSDENAVENFCREKWDVIRHKYEFIIKE